MYRDTTYAEEIKLLETVERLNIPFIGIDADTETFTRQTTAAAASEKAYYENELPRIATMVKNIFMQADKSFQNGGIIFISVGRNHAHRLAANLLQHAVTQKNESIQVHAFSLESHIAEEFMDDSQYAIRLTNDLDSSDIQDIYKRLPLRVARCSFQKEMFVAPELEVFLQPIIASCQPLQAPHSSIFQALPSHDQLLADIQHYLQENPHVVTDKTFITAIQEQRYDVALRKACAVGNTILVRIFIKYCDSLDINVTATSQNGNTPSMWFKASTASDSDKKEILTILEELESKTHRRQHQPV